MDAGEIHHDLQMIQMSVPDDASRLILDPADLPMRWNTYPAPRILAAIGNAWLSANSSLLLFVPSVIDPLSQNVLINPSHPELAKLKIEGGMAFDFDFRLFKPESKAK